MSGLDFPSFAGGFIVCACIAGGYWFGWQAAIRHHRRIARHGRNLDLVYWEDANRDDSIMKPQASAQRADIHAIEERQSTR